MDGKHIMVEIPSNSKYNPNTRDPISNKMFFGGRLEYKERTYLFFRSDDYCDVHAGHTLVDLDENEVIAQKVWELIPSGYKAWMEILRMSDDNPVKESLVSLMLEEEEE